MDIRFITCLVAAFIFNGSTITPAFAGEDPDIIYVQKDGSIDTSADTGSSGYMRNTTKLQISCDIGGCPDTPEAPVGAAPVARNDTYSSYGRNMGPHQYRSFTGLNPVVQILPCGAVNTGMLRCKQGSMASMKYSLTVLGNDTAGSTGSIKISNAKVTSASFMDSGVSVLPTTATATASGNQLEVLLSFARGVYLPGGSATVSYTITDTEDRSSTAVVTLALSAKISPLVLDLNGNGIEIASLSGKAIFDINMDGILDRMTWPQPSDGFLVLDNNDDNIINHRYELFGNTEDGAYADGFANLLQFDANDDFIINQDDPIYKRLMIWRDIDQDGTGKGAELQSLQDAGIVSINLNATESGFNIGQNVITHESYYVGKDGKKRQIADVWFDQVFGVEPPKK